MNAVRIHEHGGPEALIYEEVPDPQASDGQVLISIEACALNHLDIWVRNGLPRVKTELPRIPGSDIAGIVEAVGEEVNGVSEGDRVLLYPALSCGHCEACLAGIETQCREYSVLGYRVDGGYAEYVTIPVKNVIPIPGDLSFEEAASIPLVFVTAWHMLVGLAKVEPGEVVLVHAVGSGVGSAAVQIAKLRGARVIGTAGSTEKLQKGKELGADEGINYSEQDVVEEVKRLTERKGVDVVIEHVGPATWEGSVKSLARGGRLVTCGATTGPTVELDLRYVFSRQLAIYGSYMGTRAELMELLPFFEDGKLRPVVDRSYPLAEAQEAHKLVESRGHFGKIVLKP